MNVLIVLIGLLTISGSPFPGTRRIRLRVAIPSHGTPRRAQVVFHSFGWDLKIRPWKVGNPPRAISQARNAHPPSIVPVRGKLPIGLSRPVQERSAN
jgi:hypothetical protein